MAGDRNTRQNPYTRALYDFGRELAAHGIGGLLRHNRHAAKGLNIRAGKVYHEGVSKAFDLQLSSLEGLP